MNITKRSAKWLLYMAITTMMSLTLLLPLGCTKIIATRPADDMVNAMIKGDFTSATRDFDATMKAAVSVDVLRLTWEQLITKSGKFKARERSHQMQSGETQIVEITCHFEKGSWIHKVTVDKNSKICALSYRPLGSRNNKFYTLPSYAHKERYYEKDVIVGSGAWQVQGTITIPMGKGPFPLVILVHDAGQNDRDETFGLNKPFKDIALGLASQSISVLRYDSRGYDTRTRGNLLMIGNKLTAKDVLIDGVVAAIELSRKLKMVDHNRIYILGHGEGGYLVPRIVKADNKIAGSILLAANARPLEDMLLERSVYVWSISEPVMSEFTKTQLMQTKQHIASVKALKGSSNGSTRLLGLPISYWLYLKGYDPAAVAKSLKQPILIMQGGRDYHSTSADYKIWKDALTTKVNSTLRFYPGLNHFFMTGSGIVMPSEYGIPGNVSEQVITDISNWIHKQK